MKTLPRLALLVVALALPLAACKSTEAEDRRREDLVTVMAWDLDMSQRDVDDVRDSIPALEREEDRLALDERAGELTARIERALERIDELERAKDGQGLAEMVHGEVAAIREAASELQLDLASAEG